MVGRTVTDWRDKRLLEIPREAIARVSVEHGTERYALQKRDSIWTFAGGEETDSVRVRRMLDGFGNLLAQGVSFATDEQADSIDFGQPDRRVIVWSAAGDTLAHLAFDSTASGFWVQKESGGTIYHVFTWKVNEIAPADSTLRRKEEGND